MHRVSPEIKHLLAAVLEDVNKRIQVVAKMSSELKQQNSRAEAVLTRAQELVEGSQQALHAGKQVWNDSVAEWTRKLPLAFRQDAERLDADIAAIRVQQRLRNVVLFPVKGYESNFQGLSFSELGRLLGVEDLYTMSAIAWRRSVKVIRFANDSDKRRVLNSSFRKQLASVGHVVLKDDLLPEERMEQRQMQVAMTALYNAQFFPTWRRSRIVWWVNGRQFDLCCVDVLGKSPQQVVDMARQKCVAATNKGPNDCCVMKQPAMQPACLGAVDTDHVLCCPDFVMRDAHSPPVSHQSAPPLVIHADLADKT
jgi:hypothetical protein